MPDLLSIETWRNIFTKHASKLGWGLAAVIGLPLIAQFGMGQFSGRGNNSAAVKQNGDLSATVATINGVPVTRREYEATASQNRSGGEQTTEQKAQARGAALYAIADHIAVIQEADARKVVADDATVDRQVQQYREQLLGPDAKNDAKWSQFLSQGSGLTPTEFRANIAKDSLRPALLESFKKDLTLTDADAKKQSTQVKLQLVFVGSKNTGIFASMTPNNDKLPDDATAKAKAETLLKEAKGGANLADIAKSNSTDVESNKVGGTLPFQPEYGRPEMAQFGILHRGKDFDETVQKTPTGQLTEVVKASGMTSGYLFAKVLERKNDLPKDFNAAKALDELKTQEASVKLQKFLEEKVRTAKIDVTDPAARTYFDYFRLLRSQNAQMIALQGGGEEAKRDQLSKDQETALSSSVEAGFEKILKDDPTDASVAMLLAEFIKKKPHTDATRDRLIALYETTLKGSENQAIRLELAGMYREKKDFAKSKEQYDYMARLQGRKPIYNTQSANEAVTNYKQLITAYKSVNAPDDAAKLEPKLADATIKQKDYQVKDSLEQLKNQPSPNLSVPPIKR